MHEQRAIQKGFTIVELLIVIVVIGILAAITIVAYNGIQKRAVNTSIESDLASFKKKIEVARIDSSDGLYPSTLTSAMGFSFTKSAYKTNRYNLYYCTSSDRMNYAFGVISTYDSNYMISSVAGLPAQPTGSDSNSTSTCAVVGAPTGGTQGHTYVSSVSAWVAWTN